MATDKPTKNENNFLKLHVNTVICVFNVYFAANVYVNRFLDT